MYEEVLNECFFCLCLVVQENLDPDDEYGSCLKDTVAWLVDGRCQQYGCLACGAYSLTGGKHINSIVGQPDALANVRHFLAVRKRESIDDPSKRGVLKLTGELLSPIMDRPILSPPEQADNMIRFWRNQQWQQVIKTLDIEFMEALLGQIRTLNLNLSIVIF